MQSALVPQAFQNKSRGQHAHPSLLDDWDGLFATSMTIVPTSVSSLL